MLIFKKKNVMSEAIGNATLFSFFAVFVKKNKQTRATKQNRTHCSTTIIYRGLLLQ